MSLRTDAGRSTVNLTERDKSDSDQPRGNKEIVPKERLHGRGYDKSDKRPLPPVAQRLQIVFPFTL